MRRVRYGSLIAILTCGLVVCAACVPAQEPPPTPMPSDKPLPINLPTALQLANTRAIDVALASERIRLACAQLEGARVLWLPTLLTGVDYWRHDGQIQNVEGRVFGVSRSTLMLGTTPNAVFAVSDAIFAPLARRQMLRARQADQQTAMNDAMLSAAEAYFNVQQARGDLAGAIDASRRADDLVRRAEKLAESVAPAVEAARARTEAARRRQAVQLAQARWQLASAELIRIIRLDPTALVEPIEPPHLQITLVAPSQCVDELIPIALTQRPELASQRALVDATIELLRHERVRPLVPSVLLRGASTNPAGTLAAGVFGGGVNSNLSDFSMRSDFDIQLLWELRNLGLGNRALVNERRSEHRIALLEKFRIQDRVAAEVAKAHAEAQTAATRAKDAQDELKNAVDSVDKNFEGLGQTRRAGNLLILVIRPQEAVAAVQALALAYADFYGAIADYNRAEFRLYRALGHPAQMIDAEGCVHPPAPARKY